MSGVRILVVDDEAAIRRGLRTSLGAQGYQVQVAASGDEALLELERHRPEMVLLDLQMPSQNGLEVCRLIRERSDVPIIIMSVSGDEPTKVQGLNLGADDYVTKPFGIDELVARIRANLRRAAGARPSGAAVVELGDIRIDLERREVVVHGQLVSLRPKEFDILRYLVTNAGKLVTHRMLLSAVWGAEYVDDRSYLHVYIGQLRRKIEPNPAHPIYLRTEPGVGYRYVPQESAPAES